MAEEVSQTATLDTPPPASADNGEPSGGETGTPTSSGESTQDPTQRSQEPWEKLGYASWDDLERTHGRYREQISGSQREAQRLQQELAERDRRLADYERRTQPQQPQPQQPQALNFSQAVEAYLNGDQQAMAQYEYQQQARFAEQAQQAVLSTLGTVVKPAQYSDAVLSEFPDLNDPKSAMYREVYARYDQEAVHPRYKLFYAQDDPGAYRDAWSPDGVEHKRVDMRIVYPLALKVQAELARNQGRQDETKRRAAAGAAGGPGTPPPAKEAEGPLLYDDEIIHDPRVRAAMAANGKGSDPRTMRSWFWKNLPEREKRRRQALRESGQWTTRRSA